MGNSNYSKGFDIGSEFSGADFSDPRLANRLQKIAASLATNPKESFPKALGHGAGTEGGYRFLRNDRVDFQKITEPHIRETRLRAEAKDEVLAIHDTTEFKFSSGQRREGLGWLRHSKSSAQGFFGHFSFAVSGGKKPRPLGVVAVEPSVRQGKKKGYQSPLKRKQDPTRKSLRWMRGVEAANEALGEKVNAIHVMDREADFFELLSEMLDLKCRYVIRVCRDRLLEDSEGLYETLEGVQVKLKRQVPISSRKRSPLPSSRKIHPPRQKRLAKLHVRATKVVLKRTHHNDSSLNALIPINVIHVFEPNPPKGETPVDWKLLTTEAIDTKKEVEKVVDTYRARWLIEEYFKAIKTGCAFEKRQLESFATILNALGILIPIAWRLLLVRNTVREEPTAPAHTVLTRTQIDVLKYFCPKKLPDKLTVTDALYGIAALGGHLTQNGPPGWIVLGRGLTELLTLEKGWSAAKA